MIIVVKATNDDCCKGYREKNAEEYKINDTLRRKRARLLLKSNTVKMLMKNRRKRKEKENGWLNIERVLL